MSTLRTGDNGRIIELTIPKDTLEVLEKIVPSDKTMDADGLELLQYLLQCIYYKEYFVNKFWRWLVNQCVVDIKVKKTVELYEGSSQAGRQTFITMTTNLLLIIYIHLQYCQLRPKFYLQYCQLRPKFYLQYCQLRPKFYLQYCQLRPKFYLQYCQRVRSFICNIASRAPKFYLQYCQLCSKFYLQYCHLRPKFYLQYCQVRPKFYLHIHLDFSLEMHFHLRSTLRSYFAQKPRTLIISQLEIERKLSKNRTTSLARVLIEGLALNFSAYNT